jgi:D-beta-D-heptose 7-phosphate kinase / D-beta-D-heptose 1-phosphate adenosyltransferase
MQAFLPEHLPDFKQASVLVIGDVMLDRYWFGDTLRVSPEAPVPIVKINNTDDRPGGAGNVALNLAALGTQVNLLGVTGLDSSAKALNEQLSQAHINCHFYQSADVTTIIKLRVLSRHQQLLRMDFEEQLAGTHQEHLIQNYQNCLSSSKLVILSDYNKGTLSDPQTLIQLARQAHIPVLVDPKGNDFSIYRHANILTPNFKEFETIVGSCKSEEEIFNKGLQLLNDYQIDSLLITRGEAGMTLIEAGRKIHFPAHAREVFDVTGAGDTVIAVLGAAVAAGLDLIAATALANLAAGIAVSKLGATAVSFAELDAALTGKTHLANGIVNEQQLLAAIQAARIQGKKIIFTNGCFDILHPGHITYLQLAKQLGDYLIVAVNEDESIRKLKGPKRPVNSLEHRMSLLAALSVVDWVVPFADETPERLLRLLQPDLLVKGSDYQADKIVGADIVRSYGGEARIIHHPITTSSTALIERIQQTEGT